MGKPRAGEGGRWKPEARKECTEKKSAERWAGAGRIRCRVCTSEGTVLAGFQLRGACYTRQGRVARQDAGELLRARGEVGARSLPLLWGPAHRACFLLRGFQALRQLLPQQQTRSRSVLAAWSFFLDHRLLRLLPGHDSSPLSLLF